MSDLITQLTKADSGVQVSRVPRITSQRTVSGGNLGAYPSPPDPMFNQGVGYWTLQRNSDGIGDAAITELTAGIGSAEIKLIVGLSAASAVITFTGNPTVNISLDITDAAGTKISYTAKADENLGSNHFTRTGDGGALFDIEVIANSLRDCINNSAGHNGTLTASVVVGVLTIINTVKGTSGNTVWNKNIITTTNASGVEEAMANTTVTSQFVGGTESNNDGTFEVGEGGTKGPQGNFMMNERPNVGYNRKDRGIFRLFSPHVHNWNGE